MPLRFRLAIWRGHASGFLSRVMARLRTVVRVAIFVALLACAIQLLLLAASWWNDSILEADLLDQLGPHQTIRSMESGIAARVAKELGDAPVEVRVDVICPAPGPPGPLENIAPTCLLSGHVRYERQVWWIRRRVHLQPTEKAFQEAIPMGTRR